MATLNEKINLARDLFGTSKTDAPSVNRISGTATADSSDGTVTVQLDDGDVIELGTIGSVRSGQTVTVHVQGNSAQVIAAEGWGDAIQTTVDEAAEVANAINQHFWSDDNGAHITEVTQDEWNDSSDPNYHSGYNSLWNSLGLLFRKAMNNLVSITQSGTTFYDGSGNAAANVTASFGSSGAQIGKVGESHIELDYRSMRMIDKNGSAYFDVRDLRDDTGYATITDTFTGDGTRTSFFTSMAISLPAQTTVAVSDGSGGTVTVYSNAVSFSSAPTDGATITVIYKNNTGDAKSYTFGTRASGSNVGGKSVAMGTNVTASHGRSVAMGASTITSSSNSLAMGIYNEPVPNTAFIIGNGTSTNRSNALTVDWSGNVEAAGDVSGATLSSAGGLTLFGSTAFDGMFSTDAVSTPIGSIAAGSSKWVTIDTTRANHAAIALVGYYINGANMLVPYCARMSGTDAQFALRNSGTSASSSSATIEAQVLYVKTA